VGQGMFDAAADAAVIARAQTQAHPSCGDTPHATKSLPAVLTAIAATAASLFALGASPVLAADA
jgi:hypothetical protein